MMEIFAKKRQQFLGFHYSKGHYNRGFDYLILKIKLFQKSYNQDVRSNSKLE